MATEEKEGEEGEEGLFGDWPPSNYPILAAILLLMATAVSLAAGMSEDYANQLAIYAYYFLVIGISIRFIELGVSGEKKEWLVEKTHFVLDRVGGRIGEVETDRDFSLRKRWRRATIYRELAGYVAALLVATAIYSFFLDQTLFTYIPLLVLLLTALLALHLLTPLNEEEESLW